MFSPRDLTSRQSVTVLGIAITACLATLFVLVGLTAERPVESSTTPLRVRRVPLRLSQEVPRFPILTESDHARLAEAMELSGVAPVPPAGLLHLLKADGLSGCYRRRDIASGHQIVELLTNDQRGSAYFGSSIMKRTTDGVRYELTSSRRASVRGLGESHRDQCLATFGEIGLSLGTRIVLDGVELRLSDVLNDSIASFHLDQAELSWTVTAYMHYLQPGSTWTNRFGQTYSFDDLAAELLSRDLESASCGGTHILCALALMARVQCRHRLLSHEQAQRVASRLENYVGRSVGAQGSDGAWSNGWFSQEKPDDRRGPTSGEQKVLLTGHIVEWLMLLPDELRPPPEVYHRAALWLYRAVSVATDNDWRDHYCPYVHAAVSLRKLSIVRVQRAEVVAEEKSGSGASA